MMTKGREANLDQITPHVVHPALHQDYELDFQLRRVNDIAPTLTSPMLAGIASSVHLIRRPVVPKGPDSPKTEEGLPGRGGALAQPAIPGPSHIGGPMEQRERNHWRPRQSISTPPSRLISPRTQLTSSY